MIYCQPRPDEPLTRRQKEVLQLIARGLTNQQIAEVLVISRSTANNHVHHILERLGVPSRTKAAVLAVQLKILEEDEQDCSFTDHSILATLGSAFDHEKGD